MMFPRSLFFSVTAACLLNFTFNVEAFKIANATNSSVVNKLHGETASLMKILHDASNNNLHRPVSFAADEKSHQPHNERGVHLQMPSVNPNRRRQHQRIARSADHPHAKRHKTCKSKGSKGRHSSTNYDSSSSTSSTSGSDWSSGSSSSPSGQKGSSSSHSDSSSSSKGHSGSGSSSSSQHSNSNSHSGSGSSTSSTSDSDGSGSQSGSSSSSNSSSSGNVTNTSGSGNFERVEQNRGSGFWSGNWDFWSHADPTHGQVDYQSESGAKSKNLIGMKNGAAFMRVSTEDISSGQNRPSVRFQSKKAYDSGLIIFDVKKMPVGCGTWPALWTTMGSSWPHNGEIDVVEGTGYTSSGKDANQMTVHLGQDSPLNLRRRGASSNKYLGRLVQNANNCNQYGAHTGCAFYDSNDNGPSWGTSFNNAGGGIWAMQFGKGNTVNIWFWGRKSGKIPDELSDASKSPKRLDTSKWGSPMGHFQTSGNSQIKQQNIIMDITIGGDWAGNVPLDGPCKGKSLQQAIQKGSNYEDAEFLINAIDIYCEDGDC